MNVQVVAEITAFAAQAGINTKDVMAVLRKYGYELPGFICAWRSHFEDQKVRCPDKWIFSV